MYAVNIERETQRQDEVGGVSGTAYKQILYVQNYGKFALRREMLCEIYARIYREAAGKPQLRFSSNKS